jgi:Periplasmic protein involved in polysaccharide export
MICKFKYLFILCLLAVALSSCLTSKKVNLMQEPDGKNIPSYVDTLSFEDYRIRIDDRLYVQVYSIDENLTKIFNNGTNGTYMRQQMMQGSGDMYGTSELYSYLVDDNGNIQYPMIGDVPVRGKTTREVKYLLEEKLSELVKGVGNYAMISVDVQVVGRYFSVIGAVQSARVPLLKEKVTIFEALAMIRDIADYGDRSKIRILREVEGETTIRTFDIRSKDIINSEFYYIEPNDVIYIQYMPGHTFGINHVTTTISVVATTISFGGFIYAIVQRSINAAKRAQTNNGGGK